MLKVNITPPNKPTELFKFDIESFNSDKVKLNQDIRNLIKYMPAGDGIIDFIKERILTVGKISIQNKTYFFIMFSVLSNEKDLFGRYGMVYSSALISLEHEELIKKIESISNDEFLRIFPCLKLANNKSKIKTHFRKEISQYSRVKHYSGNSSDEILMWEGAILNQFKSNDSWSASSMTFFEMENLNFQVIYDKERINRWSWVRRIPILAFIYNLIWN